MFALLLALSGVEGLALQEPLVLTEDRVLRGSDVLDIEGRPIEGGGFRIRTEGRWTGRLRLSGCELRGLGGRAEFGPDDRLRGESHALDLHASGEASIAIETCVFSASSSIRLRVDERAAAAVVGNEIRENSLVAVDKVRGRSLPAFTATGTSSAPQRFERNRIWRSHAVFDAPGWRVEGNLIVGLRAGLFATGKGTEVRGNYVHVLMPRTPEYPWWSQVATFTTARGALAEHNVIRDGEWIVQFVEGEFRHNVICDINDHNLLRNGSTGRIHHNIFFAGKPEHPPGQQSGCVFVVYPPKDGETGVEIFNNVFDANDVLNVPGVEVCRGGLVRSLRNNAFVRFPMKEKYVRHPLWMLSPPWDEAPSDSPPARLAYADYNLFPRGERIYGLGVVEGKAGLHDRRADPGFRGPLPSEFPFRDDDIKAGRVTVPEILARFREIYAPGEGSPLRDAGDPADGPGTDIGAVEGK
ncbi:MAG TPA: hypothetical protein VF950_12350 [Planctomycetota bacterium]